MTWTKRRFSRKTYSVNKRKKKPYPVYEQNGQTRCPIWNQNGWKPYPLGMDIPNIAFIREYSHPLAWEQGFFCTWSFRRCNINMCDVHTGPKAILTPPQISCLTVTKLYFCNSPFPYFKKQCTESRSGWTKIQQMYDNVHPILVLVLWFQHTEVECGKGLLEFPNFTCLSVKCRTESTGLIAINLLAVWHWTKLILLHAGNCEF